MERPADYDHLLRHAQRCLPGAVIKIIHTDDAHVFGDGKSAFEIPLMENPDAHWDFS